MMFKVNIKSLMLGLVIGIISLLIIGAASQNSGTGQYQVSIATNGRSVFYAKIHTSTGEVETWQTPVNSVQTKR